MSRVSCFGLREREYTGCESVKVRAGRSAVQVRGFDVRVSAIGLMAYCGEGEGAVRRDGGGRGEEVLPRCDHRE